MRKRSGNIKKMPKHEEAVVQKSLSKKDSWEKNYAHEKSTEQMKKQKKQKIKMEKEGRSIVPKSIEEKNKLEKYRTSVWGERSHYPRPKK